MDPVLEADRFAQKAFNVRRPKAVIIVGSALGYLIGSVHRLHPGAKIIACNFTDIDPADCVSHSTFEWHWSERRELNFNRFLSDSLSENDLVQLQVISWQPAVAAYPERAAQCEAEIREVVAELNAGIATTGYFGRRWLRNIVSNFVSWETLTPLPPPKPVVAIAASGPSLARSIQAISRVRDRCTLWSLPSSVAALMDAGLLPDLVISTDAGYYAGEHLARLPCSIPVAMPLTASRGSGRAAGSIVPLSTGTLAETSVANLLEVVPVATPSAGTVAASALHLSRMLRVNAVVFAGFDLSQDDVLTHTRPHAFDHYIFDFATRFQPALASAFERAIPGSRRAIPNGRLRTTRSLDTFAAWFRRTLSGTDVPAYRIEASQVTVGTQDISSREMDALCSRVSSDRKTGRPSEVSNTTDAFDASATIPIARRISRTDRVRSCIELIRSAEHRVESYLQAVRASSDRGQRIDLPTDNVTEELLRWLDMPTYLALSQANISEESSLPGRIDQTIESIHRFSGSLISNLEGSTDHE